MRQVLGPGALGRPRGIGWRGRWEGGSGWGIHVYTWLILVNVWQKPLQYCKVISLQLIKINGKKTKATESPNVAPQHMGWVDYVYAIAKGTKFIISKRNVSEHLFCYEQFYGHQKKNNKDEQQKNKVKASAIVVHYSAFLGFSRAHRVLNICLFSLVSVSHVSLTRWWATGS